MNRYNKVPKKEKARDDYERAHGRSEEGAFISGLQLYRPLTAYGSELPAGSLFSTPNGDLRLYDGTARLVDSSVWNKEISEHISRRKQIEELALNLIKAGDSLAIKYLGPFYSLLQPGGWRKNVDKLPIRKWLEIDGYNKDQIDAIVESVGGDDDVDATPTSIQIENETSQEYTKKIRKMMWTLRYCGLIFTGKKNKPNPEMNISPGEEAHTPAAKGRVVREVAARHGHIDSGNVAALFGDPKDQEPPRDGN